MNPPITPALSAAAQRRQRLLEGPILSTLLSVAWPTVVQMLMYSFVLLLETWFIGKLGVVALAGASLVSPALFLMQAMAAGGMGGAVTATIAKAAGRGDREHVQSLAWHALIIAVGCGLVFAVAMHFCGPWFYHLLGGRDDALTAALEYSNVLFLGAPLIWIVVVVAAILRGLGVVKVQAVITVLASLILLPLSPILIFGVGPLPALGIRGAAIAVICYYALVTGLYLAYLASEKSAIKLRWQQAVISRKDFAAILQLGGVSSLLAVQSHVTSVIITGLAGSFGTVVLAGFGAAIRLAQVVEPVIFGLGTATVVMVATCIGAGDVARARKIAKSAAIGAGAFCGVIGGIAAVYPQLWIGLFTQDAEVIAAGAIYLRTVGPFYWCVGLGLVLYYYSQGIGRMRWTYAGSILRLAIVSLAGSASLFLWHGGAASLYWIVALSMMASCLVTALGLARIDWRSLLLVRRSGAAM
ncbi:MATE family efflux transporter [soil metagenome]